MTPLSDRALKAPRAKAARVPAVRSTLPVLRAEAERLALVSVPLDFWADALRLWEDQSFGAGPLFRVYSLHKGGPWPQNTSAWSMSAVSRESEGLGSEGNNDIRAANRGASV
jgi:hypothetical protein